VGNAGGSWRDGSGERSRTVGELVRVKHAKIEYENGDVLIVHRDKKEANRYRWSLWRDGGFEPGRTQLVAANGDAAGVSAAMTGAAAMHSQVDRDAE
jgi:hypothetical protein